MNATLPSIRYAAKCGQVYADFLAWEVDSDIRVADYVHSLEDVQHFYDHLKLGLFEEVLQWLKDVAAYESYISLADIMKRHEVWSKLYE